MKKFFKFVFGTAMIAAAGTAVYYVYKNFIAKKQDEDDFDDDYVDDDLDDEDDLDEDDREYVSINLSGEEQESDEIKESSQTASGTESN